MKSSGRFAYETSGKFSLFRVCVCIFIVFFFSLFVCAFSGHYYLFYHFVLFPHLCICMMCKYRNGEMYTRVKFYDQFKFVPSSLSFGPLEKGGVTDSRKNYSNANLDNKKRRKQRERESAIN